MHKLKYIHTLVCDRMAFHAGRLQNLGLSAMETMQKSTVPVSLMLNDELTPEPQGGLEHIFFSTVMFHEVWVVAIFFSADVAGSATPRFLIDMVEVMEKEQGTEVGHCSPWHCCKTFTRQILQTHFEWLQNQYFNIPLRTSALIILLKLVALKKTHMNNKSWSVVYIIVTSASIANFFVITLLHIYGIWYFLWFGMGYSSVTPLTCSAAHQSEGQQASPPAS